MVVELVAGRVIARHVGQSIFTWTSAIGVVLAGLTLGNFVGGRLADRFDTRKTLSALFFIAAAACLTIPLMNYEMGAAKFLTKIKDWPLRIALHVTMVFLFPAASLGLIGPVVAKRALELGLATGRTVGNVYAWGALGSIVGTFVTGFFWIPVMGTIGIIYSVAGVLALVGLAIAPLFSWPVFLSSLLAFFLLVQKGPWQWSWASVGFLVREAKDLEALYVDESQYSFIKISSDPDEGSHRRLHLDNLIHAYYVPADVTDLQYEYEKTYAAVTERFGRKLEKLRALFLGGGGYIFPRYIQARWPGSSIEVAEIDPAVTRADMAAFGLKPQEVRIVAGASFHGVSGDFPEGGGAHEISGKADGPKPIEVYHFDARNHVADLLQQKRESKDFEPFDFVYGDAFNDYSVPNHLVTKEFSEMVKEILKPRTGLYLINIIDIFDSGKFLGAVYNSMKRVFPRVYIYCNNDGGPDLRKDGRDTYIVIGALSAHDFKDLGLHEGEKKFIGSLLTEKDLKVLEERSQGIVLTDDFSPVENLLEDVVRRSDR